MPMGDLHEGEQARAHPTNAAREWDRQGDRQWHPPALLPETFVVTQQV